jgi:hypothetical protein
MYGSGDGAAAAIWMAAASERCNPKKSFAADLLQMQETVIVDTMRGCGSRCPERTGPKRG